MILLCVLSYLIGSIPTAFLVGRVCKVDIRKYGSGNVGATNVFRVLGKKWGSFTLAFDILKGFAPVFWIAPRIVSLNLSPSLVSIQLIAGVFTIAGHTWPVWLQFKGGKGVATSCGVFLGIFPKAVFVTLLIWIAVLLISRFVSLASIVAGILFPFCLLIFYRSTPDLKIALTISAALSLFIIFTHRANIKRVLNGMENRIPHSK